MSIKSPRTFRSFSLRLVVSAVAVLALSGGCGTNVRADIAQRLRIVPANGSRLGNTVTFRGTLPFRGCTVSIDGQNANAADGSGFTCTIGNLKKGTHTNTVIVTDRRGRQYSTPVWYVVTNRAPQFGWTSPAVTAHRGQEISQDSTASDPDGDPVTCTWTQLSGPETLPGLPANSAEWNVSAPNRLGTYLVEIKASDGESVSSRQFSLNVTNYAPLVSVEPYLETGHGLNTDLEATVEDPDGDRLSFLWELVSNPAPVNLVRPRSRNASFTAPQVRGDYVFRFTASDGIAASSVYTRVSVVNQPPSIVSMTEPSRLPYGAAGRLDVAAVDTDDKVLKFQWKQVSGPVRVTLNNAGTSNAGFTAPERDGTYVFEVTVSDGVNTVSNFNTYFYTPDGRSRVVYTVGQYRVYVAQGGTGNGRSPRSPLGRLDRAFSLAQTNGAVEICISGNPALGEETALNGMKDLKITGGWNAAFTSQGAASVLDGGYRLDNVLSFTNCSGVLVSNVVVTGAVRYGILLSGDYTENPYEEDACYGFRIYAEIRMNRGGGLRISGNNNFFSGIVFRNSNSADGACFDNDCTGSGIEIRGCSNTVNGLVTNNSTKRNGGGLRIRGDYNVVNARIAANHSGHCGGGAEIRGNHNVLNGPFIGNSAFNDGGGVYVTGYDNTFNGALRGNHAENTSLNDYDEDPGACGGGAYVEGSGNTFNCDITGNSAGGPGSDEANSGGGVCVKGTENTFNGAITNNASYFGGGADVDGNNNTFDGLIAGNAAKFGGGVYLSGSHNQFGMTEISGNRAKMGGGVYVIGTYNVFTCKIRNNTASDRGGGVYSYDEDSHEELPNGIIDNTVTGNSPDNICGSHRD